MGDPSGIGPCIIPKALAKLKGQAEFLVIGDSWVLGKNQNCELIDLNNVKRKGFSFGKIRAEYGRASIEYLDKAMELIRQDRIDCLVTCPICKEAINRAGFHYNGHTEYLIERTHVKDVVMMLLNDYLKFSLVTRHIPLKDVSGQLNKDLIRKTILLTRRSLRKLFAIKNPRIVILGLNPHASDNGLIGSEENRIIRPLLKSLRIAGVYGPLPADVAILRAYKRDYDCIVALYHDQALIPLKLLGDETGVNLTLGLPFVRTSPLHGTAFDIAGTNLAKADSLIAAIKLAIKCTQNQRKV